MDSIYHSKRSNLRKMVNLGIYNENSSIHLHKYITSYNDEDYDVLHRREQDSRILLNLLIMHTILYVAT